MTKIEIDVGYYRDHESRHTLELHCCPMLIGETREGSEDEIVLTFFRKPNVGKDKQLLQLVLDPEQCRELMWALDKMVKIGDDYRAGAIEKG